MKWFFMIMMMASFAIAQTVSPTLMPSASPVLAFQPPPPTLINWITSHLGIIGTVAGVISEIILHVVGIKLDKVLGWFYALEALFRWIAKLFGALGDLIHILIGSFAGKKEEDKPTPPPPAA